MRSGLAEQTRSSTHLRRSRSYLRHDAHRPQAFLGAVVVSQRFVGMIQDRLSLFEVWLALGRGSGYGGPCQVWEGKKAACEIGALAARKFCVQIGGGIVLLRKIAEQDFHWQVQRREASYDG